MSLNQTPFDMIPLLSRSVFTTLALALGSFTTLAQPECASTWLWFDVEAPDGTALESVYFWVTPLNGLTVVVAEGELGFWNGGSTTSEAQVCLPEGCYFVGLEVPAGADWEPDADFVTDGLDWEMTDMEPMWDGEQLVGYTFCVMPDGVADCDVEVGVSMTPSGAYLFEATGGPDGAYYSWFVNGSMLQSGENPMFDWYDNLGAPTWEVCVVMDTPAGCVDETCVGPEDLMMECTLELAGGWNGSGTAVFEAYNFPEGVVLNWQVNGQWMNMGANVLEIADDVLLETTEVCVFYESPNCPEGVWACTSIEPNGCIDASLIDPNMGCVEIWAPVCGCNGVTYSNECYATYYGGVTSWTEGECGGGSDCPTGIAAIPPKWNMCEYLFMLAGVTSPEAEVVWDFGDGTEVEGGSEVVHVYDMDGTYNVSAWYVSEACPDGMALSMVVQVVGCGGGGPCEPAIEAWPSDLPGVWNFLVYDAANPNGGPLSDAVVAWTFSTGEVVEGGGDGPVQVPFWGTDDVAWACVTVMCQGAVVETCWETANPNDGVACENVVIGLNVAWSALNGVDPLVLDLVLSMADVDLDLDLSQLVEGGTYNETLSLCLPVGFCYELEVALDEVGDMTVDVFEVAAGVGQELPAWQDILALLGGTEGSWTLSLGVDVLEGCDEVDGVEMPHAAWTVEAFPNPASSRLEVTLPAGAEAWLLTGQGQRLMPVPAQAGTGTLDVSQVAPGLYVLEVWHLGERRTLPVVVAR